MPKVPTISSLKAVRWDATNNVQDDEGTSAKVTITWSTDQSSGACGNTNKGTVTATIKQDVSGSSASTISSNNFSGTFTNAANGTAYIVVPVDIDKKYNITVKVANVNSYQSNSSSYSTRSVIVSTAYFVMDFKAGGTAIGMGRAAPDSGLAIAYNTTIDNYLYLGLNTGAAASTPDGKLYGAITALGWESEVIG